MTRALYLVRSGWQGDPHEAHEAVVETLENGAYFLDIALELWSLAGNEERVNEINRLLEPAFERPNHDLDLEEIATLGNLLGGLDESLAAWLDGRNMIRPELLPEVRRRTRMLEVDEGRGALAGDGLSEGLAKVDELRAFLRQGIELGLHLSLD